MIDDLLDDDDDASPPPPGALALSAIDAEGYDKSTWGDGPWQTEQDRQEWLFQDVPCLMIRHPQFGSWTGYAGAEPGHVWHGNARSEIECEAHGGITFAGPADEYMRMLSRPGQFMNVWWIGFDCGHAWDLMPGMRALLKKLDAPRLSDVDDDVYRDASYVTSVVNAIAMQIIETRRR